MTRKTTTALTRKIANAIICVAEPSTEAKMLNVPSHDVKPESDRVVMNSFTNTSGESMDAMLISYELYAVD